MNGVNLWHDLSAGNNVPNEVNVVIEIPKGTRNKYELSKEHGMLMLDRVLYSSIHYPGDYGFIPQSYFEDGDPMDIVVMISHPTFPGCIVPARPIGMLKIIDRGEPDYKILAVATGDPTFDDYYTLEHVPAHYRNEVEHFFTTYKLLEGAVVDNEGWATLPETKKAIVNSLEYYQKEFGDRKK